MKKLTSSVYSFEKLVNEGMLYVDKTEYIWNLIQNSGAYFLARPRRFGKSLTVSTLEAIFQGRKELFKGLAIYDKPYDWTPYPVIHLDLNGFNFSSLADLNDSLRELLSECAELHGVELESGSPVIMFRRLLTAINRANGKFVILLDEYDKPILNSLGQPYASDILSELKSFYSVIKAFDKFEHFVFITGASKFAHVSLFSDLNNLTDISMRPDYATMFGYTQCELETYFAEYIDAATRKLGMEREAFLEKLKKWYDGYCFEANTEAVYSPVSVAKFFSSDNFKFDYYWSDTGTPSFLIDYCKNNSFDIEGALANPVPSATFGSFEINRINPLALFLQAGYLTIRDSYEELGHTFYRLKFANIDVQSSFEEKLLDAYTELPEGTSSQFSVNIVKTLKNGDVDGAMRLLKSFYAGFAYKFQEKSEHYYQAIFFAIFRSLGFSASAESPTSDGSIDAVVEIDDWIYVFELKLDVSAQKALEQIEEKDYCRKYIMTGKRIMLVGMNFNSRTRQLVEWTAREFER